MCRPLYIINPISALPILLSVAVGCSLFLPPPPPRPPYKDFLNFIYPPCGRRRRGTLQEKKGQSVNKPFHPPPPSARPPAGGGESYAGLLYCCLCARLRGAPRHFAHIQQNKNPAGVTISPLSRRNGKKREQQQRCWRCFGTNSTSPLMRRYYNSEYFALY